MGDIINLAQYKNDQKLKQERKCKKDDYIKKMKRAKTRRKADEEFYKLVDLFLLKHYPDAFWKFDLFINGELDWYYLIKN